MRDFITSLSNNFSSPLIAAFVTFVIYILLAKIADIFTDKIIRRLTKFTKSNLDDTIIDLMHRPVFFTVIIFGSVHAISILNVSDKIIFYTSGFLFTLLVVLWCICLIKVSNAIMVNSRLSRDITPLVANIWTVLVIVGSVMFVLSIWKINITPLLASAGIVGVAVALAAKDTLANFFGGISVFVDKPYKIGDYIVLDQGERGEVVNIGIRSTRITTRDGIMITIPNSIIANTKIINESAPIPNFRFRVPVSVSYGTDIERVEEILMEIAGTNDNVMHSPDPRVRFRSFGDSALNFELLCWAREPAVRGKTIHEINKAIYHAFNTAGITIPFPHRTVYIREEKNWQKKEE